MIGLTADGALTLNKAPTDKSKLAEQIVTAEVQECFGNAFLELLTGPRNEAETFGQAGNGSKAENVRREALLALTLEQLHVNPTSNPFGSLLSLSVATVHGRMTVNFNYNEGVLGEATIDALVAGVCGRLQRGVQPEGAG